MESSVVFHEAFDPTRTSDRHSAHNLAQAQAEALVDLLLGYTLSLPDTSAFDSRAVLDLVRVVLSARDDVARTLRAGSAGHRRLMEARPFLVCWFGADSFSGACAQRLRRMDPDNPGNRSLLSAWSAIDLDYERRCDLADTLLSGPDPERPKWLEEYADLPGHFDAVTMISRYAGAYDRGRPFSMGNAVDLIDYLEHFRQLGASGELRRLASQWGCPEDVAIRLWERIDREMDQLDGRPILSSRSWIHVAVWLAERHKDPDWDVLILLKELIDCFYNARLAQACYADHAYVSSVRRTSNAVQLQSVNRLAVNIINHKMGRVVQPPQDGVFMPPVRAPLGAMPLRQLFRAYWEIVGDDDRHRTWQASCGAVNDMLRRRVRSTADGEVAGQEKERKGQGYREWTSRFRDAWAIHMSVLAGQLPRIMPTDDRTLRVVVGQDGAAFRRSHRASGEEAQALTPAEAEVILATGRYVSDIADWVNA
jgi:hypothetical protein